MNRREFAAASIAAGAAMASTNVNAKAHGEISHTAAQIHQEIEFRAPAARVYSALTVAAEFDEVVQLSAAMATMKEKLGTTPTTIEAEPGGAFHLFGGYVSGRNLVLAPNTLIVQAWRAASWDDGAYSIAHFALREMGDTTRLIFDHLGFPRSDAQHLAKGWHENYWEPLAKSLA